MSVIKTTVLTAIAPAVWGTTYLVTSEYLPAGHPLFSGLVRALPAGLLAIVLTRTLPTGAWWPRAALLGVLNIGAFFPLLFLTAYRLPGGVAATLNATQPIVVAILAVALLSEALSWWRLGWGLIGVLGVALIVLTGSATLDGVSLLAGIGAAASMATGVTLTKRWGRPDGVGAMAFAGWQLTAGGLFLLPITLLVEGVPDTITWSGIGGYVWLGLFGGLLTYTLWFSGIGRLPVTSAALLGLLSPIVAAGLGVALLGQLLSGVQLVGFALALAAIAAGQFNPPRRATAYRSRQPVDQLTNT
ncbi:EamA family transporter [Rhodococcus sp. H36-A4]|uniref:EamA family transporter n=1 Tax=Rhodococcus sp. H36-A4 TaxID=3004353 RepID=UPI0022AEC342|nr:EamA family transporter [Rhodococcus sp. H36-A4]MCZ4076981.1 EamA family transporter [Rhodococcus sp. H36-A4]